MRWYPLPQGRAEAEKTLANIHTIAV